MSGQLEERKNDVGGRIGVLGLGNLMRTDDAAGMLAVERLRTDDRMPMGVVLIDGGTLGLDLLGRLDGITHLLALDAVDFGGEPGALRRFDGDELSRLPTSKSVHLLGFADLMNVLRLMEAPEMTVTLMGVQPESTDWGTELTETVQKSFETLLEAALLQIARWTNEIAAETTHAEDALLPLQHWPAFA
ncbi:MAG: hydrogenase maturation protease [Acidobacteriota bacterium]